jgi:PPK2 family polyphosphate:nucleotide phosphotransferase
MTGASMHLEPVPSGAAVSLADSAARLPDEDAADKSALHKRLDTLTDRLDKLQYALYAEAKRAILVVLQGRDTSGKDGTIRNVFGPLDPQSTAVTSFKPPTEQELRHDFLWRVHQATPGHGLIGIFNRSHYEDVLVARAHKLVPEKVCRARFDHINAFERLLNDSRTIVLKFYLHISKDEQKRRLLKREEETVKSWKLSVGDWQEREHWDDYTEAYEDALNNCNTKHAPWFIVPADNKWFRNLAIAEALRDALAPFKEKWLETLEEMGREERKAIEEYHKKHHKKDDS